jgi:tetratricopeptide (TPR) repeat protein
MRTFAIFRATFVGTLLVSSTSVLAQTSPPPAAVAAPTRTPRADSARTANRLDSEGRTADARAIFTALIASASTDAERAAATRAMAMSFAFDANCSETTRLEEQVIAYWRTREQAEPQNAFYQQGEMANEAARVCIDAGDLNAAERLYRRGRDLGLREPQPRTHPGALWDFRTEHALARLAARRGQKARAMGHVEMAKSILAADTAMARDQRRFLPYLEGYVALYLGDFVASEQKLRETIAMPGNANDPYFHYLLAEALEKQGKVADARAMYQIAYDKATGHNPPAAFTRPAARRKLGAQ